MIIQNPDITAFRKLSPFANLKDFNTNVETKLSKEAKDLLRQFDALTGDSLKQAERETAEKDAPPKKESNKKKKFWKN